MAVMATNPGVMVDSNTPRKKRAVARPAKEEQLAVIMRIPAQRIILAPRNFARGSF
jgi:hypothetical protein